MAYDFTVPETVDLADSDRQLTDTETCDVIHRAGFPRSAVARAIDADGIVGLATVHACAMADARCGIGPDTPPGPARGADGARGTLRWYRHYIAELDAIADLLCPAWRDEPAAAPYRWTEIAFGPIGRRGVSSAPVPAEDGRNRDVPSVQGVWTFDLPPSAVEDCR